MYRNFYVYQMIIESPSKEPQSMIACADSYGTEQLFFETKEGLRDLGLFLRQEKKASYRYVRLNTFPIGTKELETKKPPEETTASVMTIKRMHYTNRHFLTNLAIQIQQNTLLPGNNYALEHLVEFENLFRRWRPFLTGQKRERFFQALEHCKAEAAMSFGSDYYRLEDTNCYFPAGNSLQAIFVFSFVEYYDEKDVLTIKLTVGKQPRKTRTDEKGRYVLLHSTSTTLTPAELQPLVFSLGKAIELEFGTEKIEAELFSELQKELSTR